MRKSKLANICLCVSLGIILLDIIAIIIMLKTPYTLVKVISWISKPLMLLSIIILIASIISLIRVLISKRQLKGLAKSITALVLSIIIFMGAFVQGFFAEAIISSGKTVDSIITEGEGEETSSNYIPEFVEKDFDTVAVAKYSDKNNPGYYKAGFIDKSGDFVIEPKFNDVKDFYEGLAPAEVDDKWGYIDKTGEFVIKPQFEKADIFSSGVAAVKVDDKWGVIDKTGTFTIQPSLENPIRFVDGLAVMTSEDTGGIGYIDITGRFVVEPVYMFAERFFSEGYAFVSKDSDFKTQGYVDKMGTFVEIPIRGKSLEAFFSENLVPVYEENGRGGYIDNTWEFVIEPSFSMVSNFSEGLAAVRPQGEEKVGYIDKTGNIVIEPKFEYTKPFSEGLALVSNISDLNGPYGYIDKTGNYVIEPKFRYADSFSEELALVSTEDDGWGFIDKTGKYIIGPVKHADFGKFRKVDGIFDRKKAEIADLEIK